MPHTQHTDAQKQRAVRKYLDAATRPPKEGAVQEVATEFGVTTMTLRRWAAVLAPKPTRKRRKK